MASLKDATKLTDDLEQLVDDLRSELENGDVDFDKLVSLSDEISEGADGLAETFSSINDTLAQRLGDTKGNGSSRSNRSQQKSSSKAGSSNASS